MYRESGEGLTEEENGVVVASGTWKQRVEAEGMVEKESEGVWF